MKIALLVLLIPTLTFAQKIDIRVYGGINTLFGTYKDFEYNKTNPSIGASLRYAVTNNTKLGVYAQNDWLSSESKGSVYGTNSKMKISSSYLNLGVCGLTYLGGSVFYVSYSIGYMVNYKSKLDHPSTGEKEWTKTNIPVVSTGVGADFSRKWKVSPFIEVNPAYYFLEDKNVMGIQTKIGVRF